jgi:hypothetical protein
MRLLTWVVALVGVICIIAGTTMVNVPDVGIVETIKLLPQQPAKALICWGMGVLFLTFALYLRANEDST